MKIVYISMTVAVFVIGGVLISRNTRDGVVRGPEISDSLSPAPVAVSSPEATATSMPIKRSAKPTPTPGIIISEVVSYDAWVKWFDPQNRRLALDKDCTSIVPSQVDYPNNVEIMLDNSASAKARILKIGGREYSLNAHAWIVTTIRAEKLPANLPLFCGDMELGSLTLVAQ